MFRKINFDSSVLIGHLFFLVYILFTVIFYKERVIFYDSSFHLFKIINFDSYSIEASRYSSFFVQTIIVLGLQLGLSLKLMVLLYSVSYPIIFYICFLICVYVFKHLPSALIMIFSLVVGQGHVWFCPIADTHQTLVFCALFYGWLNFQATMKTGVLSLSVSALLALLCLYSHPVSVFVLTFVTVYHLSLQKKIYKPLPVIIGCMVVLYLVVKLYTTPANSYEGSFFTNVRNFTQVLPGFFSLSPFKFIAKMYIGTYFLPTLFGIASVIILVRQKQIKALWVFILGIAGLFLVTIVSYYQGDSDVQMERAFMPIVFFGFFPVAHFFAGEMEGFNMSKWVAPTVVCAILLLGLAHIKSIGRLYSSRISNLYELLDRTKGSDGAKFLVTEQDLKDLPVITWTLPFETMCLSALNNPDEAKTLYMTKTAFNADIKRSPSLFLGPDFWPVWDSKKFDKRYFNLKEGQYLYLPADEK
jgi:hypothetical protein